MSKSRLINRLSLWKGERIEVRDCSTSVFQGLTKSPEGRYRVLLGPDDSKSERRQSLVWPEIVLVSGRVFRGGGSHDLNRPIRWQVSRPDNRNPECKDRWDAVVGICNLRRFDFEDGARGCVRSRSHVYGDNERESLANCLIFAVSYEKKMVTPHLNPLPAAGERRMTACTLSDEFDPGVSTDD